MYLLSTFIPVGLGSFKALFLDDKLITVYIMAALHIKKKKKKTSSHGVENSFVLFFLFIFMLL